MSAKIITVAQQKGGAGKTTIAAHLAVVLSQKGERVAVIDIDSQQSLSRWHKVREEKFGEGYSGLNFSSLSGWRVNSEISSLNRKHDYIIIDSPPHTETEAKTAIRASDIVVIPVQPSPTDLWATEATVDLAKKEKITSCLLLNRVSPNSKLAQIIEKKLPDTKVLKSRLGNRVAFASSLLEGKCVTETAPASPAALEIKTLIKEITGLLDKDTELSERQDSAQKGPELA
ncbi:MAG: ParA family protein [Rickettsiales bacterium]|nr:ParA family protein [Rickettsiales bacterium]